MNALTLDQLLVFTTTVDEHSFSGASRALSRTQSAVTYTIQKLEEQIGTPLFDRGAYRPALTPMGKALLPRARRILTDVNTLRSQAKAIVQGMESEVRFGLSDMVPIAQLAPIFSAFRAEFPTVSLRITRASFGLAESLIAGTLDLAVLPEVNLPSKLVRNYLSTMDLVAVAAPMHPLALIKGPITGDILRKELQIVLTSLGEVAGSQEYGIAALDSWRVTDLATKRGLICEGLGWGSMPEPLVAADIAAGRLSVLDIERWDGSNHLPRLNIVTAQSTEQEPGPARNALMAALAACPN
ncbi:hypothetical protein BJF97_02850 [Klebsiella sp. LTGPAF-6F]|nr:hypothetical protein BJF97_02850 [Klebsiella sp. LTGPAF-6F]